jgi:hypothetical protein
MTKVTGAFRVYANAPKSAIFVPFSLTLISNHLARWLGMRAETDVCVHVKWLLKLSYLHGKKTGSEKCIKHFTQNFTEIPSAMLDLFHVHTQTDEPLLTYTLRACGQSYLEFCSIYCTVIRLLCSKMNGRKNTDVVIILTEPVHTEVSTFHTTSP